ncbi:MAG TPA: hypothetical protein VHD84_03350 [Candidatus Saccharimonadales bacterium]|nr:hypothetical protein [Candidatus Saccharimonadales bacterium]
MPVICPSILASSKEQYHQQMDKIGRFAERIQIDLTDGQFAKSLTIKPDEAWWPVGVKADFHLMYRQPQRAVDIVLEHKPNLIIVHAEADGDFMAFSRRCRGLGVKVGVALLPQTSADILISALDAIDHVLIFSGDLGSYGGHANLSLLEKISTLKRHKPDLEIGWDGGINDQNTAQLVAGGVDVLDVGGYIQDAPDAEYAFQRLRRIADETGTT